MRRINQAGLDLIKRFEGCRLEVYLDPVGIKTVGVGHVTQAPLGYKISQHFADVILQNDLERFEEGVELLTEGLDLDDNSFSALVSFAFNLGLGALGHSTLLKKLKAGDVDGAADEFLKWTHAGGRELAGLVKRRQAERDLFLTP